MRFLPSTKFLAIAGVAGLALGLANQPTAEAATQTWDLDVSADVQSACNIDTAPLNFGPYDALGTNATNPLNGQGAVLIQCANLLTYGVGLDNGAHFSGGRRMAGPSPATTDFLPYALFEDAGRTVAWDGFSGLTGNGGWQTIDVFGRIPAAQAPQPGTYVDTVVATVTF